MVNVTMEVTETSLICNKDGDPVYLQTIFDTDFYEFTDLWTTSVPDMELIRHVENVEKYCTIVENISLNDNTLCEAVDQIGKE